MTTPDDILITAEVQLEGALEALASRLSSLRTGRVTPNLLDSVRADYHGSPTQINKLAMVAVDGRALIVRPFDPQDVNIIQDAINRSPLNLTAQPGKTVIRVPIPHLSDDRRKELSRAAQQVTEEQRVAARNIRRNTIRDLQKLKLPEDDAKTREAEADELVKTWLAKIDAACDDKIRDLTE